MLESRLRNEIMKIDDSHVWSLIRMVIILIKSFICGSWAAQESADLSDATVDFLP